MLYTPSHGSEGPRPQNFLGLPTDTHSVWARATKFVVVTPVGRGVFLRDQAHSHPWEGAQHPEKFWDPTDAHTVWPTLT